jgi:hypothetical protein
MRTANPKENGGAQEQPQHFLIAAVFVILFIGGVEID